MTSFTQSRIAVLPNGDIAQVVLDTGNYALARWCSGGTWSPWQMVTRPAVDVSIAPASVGGADVAYISVAGGRLTPQPDGKPLAEPAQALSFYTLTAAGELTRMSL